MLRQRLLAGVLALAVSLPACAPHGAPPVGTPRPAGDASASRPPVAPIRDLGQVAAFGSLFDEGRGQPRLVLLLSPT